MDAHEKKVIADFLGNNWAAFRAHAEEFDIDEARCEEIANELEGKN